MAIPGYSRLFRACSKAGVSGLFRFYRHPSYTRRKIKECLNRPSFHDDNQVCVLCNRIEKKKTVHFFDYFSFSGETSVAWDQARLRSRGWGGGKKAKNGVKLEKYRRAKRAHFFLPGYLAARFARHIFFAHANSILFPPTRSLVSN